MNIHDCIVQFNKHTERRASDEPRQCVYIEHGTGIAEEAKLAWNKHVNNQKVGSSSSAALSLIHMLMRPAADDAARMLIIPYWRCSRYRISQKLLAKEVVLFPNRLHLYFKMLREEKE
ncbi:hypothetical protein J6590_027555 [Homalodisca vitripennis]|nr:hypothetical protein J6590_027555 [Homalodisca vitripennis]